MLANRPEVFALTNCVPAAVLVAFAVFVVGSLI
jgi:hypothetical protein